MSQALFSKSPERCCTAKLTFSLRLELSLCEGHTMVVFWWAASHPSSTFQLKGLGVHTQVANSKWILTAVCTQASTHISSPSNLPQLTSKKKIHLLSVVCLSYASPCLQMSSQAYVDCRIKATLNSPTTSSVCNCFQH